MQERVVHGFKGKYAPKEFSQGRGIRSSMMSFSLGIFPLVPRASGNGYKHGTVIVRVKGPVEKKEAVYAKAREIVALLDRQEYTGPKTITIK